MSKKRLRRPPWAVLVAFGGFGLFSIFGLLFFVGGYNLSRSGAAGGLFVSLFGAILGSPLLASTLLWIGIDGGSFLVKCRILQFDVKLQQVDLHRANKAIDGNVAWGRGGSFHGIEILMKDGDSVPLSFSYFLGRRVRDRWIGEINDVIAGLHHDESRPVERS